MGEVPVYHHFSKLFNDSMGWDDVEKPFPPEDKMFVMDPHLFKNKKVIKRHPLQRLTVVEL